MGPGAVWLFLRWWWGCGGTVLCTQVCVPEDFLTERWVNHPCTSPCLQLPPFPTFTSFSVVLPWLKYPQSLLCTLVVLWMNSLACEPHTATSSVPGPSPLLVPSTPVPCPLPVSPLLSSPCCSLPGPCPLLSSPCPWSLPALVFSWLLSLLFSPRSCSFPTPGLSLLLFSPRSCSLPAPGLSPFLGSAQSLSASASSPGAQGTYDLTHSGIFYWQVRTTLHLSFICLTEMQWLSVFGALRPSHLAHLFCGFCPHSCDIFSYFEDHQTVPILMIENT